MHSQKGEACHNVPPPRKYAPVSFVFTFAAITAKTFKQCNGVGGRQTWGSRNVISNRLQLITFFSVIVIDY